MPAGLGFGHVEILEQNGTQCVSQKAGPRASPSCTQPHIPWGQCLSKEPHVSAATSWAELLGFPCSLLPLQKPHPQVLGTLVPGQGRARDKHAGNE